MVLKDDDSRGYDFKVTTKSVGVSWSGAIMGEELGLLLM